MFTSHTIHWIKETSRTVVLFCLIAAFATAASSLFFTFPGQLYFPVVFLILALSAIATYFVMLILGQDVSEREVKAALALDNLGERPIILFLRSFNAAKSGLLDRITGPQYEVEEELDDRIDGRAMFVGIGNKRVSYGAAKILVSDDQWQALFGRLVNAASIIFMMPGPSVSVLWELSQLIGAQELLEKTVFIMPRNRTAREWGKMNEMVSSAFSASLPAYAPEGCYFRLIYDSDNFETTPLESLTEKLDDYLSWAVPTGKLSGAEFWNRAVTQAARADNPVTHADWALRVAKTGYIEDAEELIKQLGGAVIYHQDKAPEAAVVVTVFGEQRGFENAYTMVQWIIKEVVPRVAQQT